MLLKEHAPAKINLTLRVLGRRLDGYHDLESLVAFAAIGDDLSLLPGETLSLEVGGPMADGITAGDDNLVLKAAQAFRVRFPRARVGRFNLIKRLPVASGIGGGSSDAAATLRLLARTNEIPANHPRLFEIAASLGADVPVCLLGRACMMRGIGDEIVDLPAPLKLFAVLVNPGVPLETQVVFRELGLAIGQRFGNPIGGAPSISRGPEELAEGVNDLEKPAIQLLPVIGDVLALLEKQQSCHLARMSGSGATCFGIYEDCRTAAAAAKSISADHPDWWVIPTLIL